MHNPVSICQPTPSPDGEGILCFALNSYKTDFELKIPNKAIL